jgi:hypothetical protein
MLREKWEDNNPENVSVISTRKERPWDDLQDKEEFIPSKKDADWQKAKLLIRKIFIQYPEFLDRVIEIGEKYPDAVLVPVLTKGSKNIIPIALADYISDMTGLDYTNEFVNKKPVSHAHADRLYRLKYRADYGGSPEEGQEYIIVDDVYSQGGAINELRRYIIAGGGKVVDYIAIAPGRGGAAIKLQQSTLDELKKEFGGGERLSNFLSDIHLYNGNYTDLTEPEAKFILDNYRIYGYDELADRILER